MFFFEQQYISIRETEKHTVGGFRDSICFQPWPVYIPTYPLLRTLFSLCNISREKSIYYVIVEIVKGKLKASKLKVGLSWALK